MRNRRVLITGGSGLLALNWACAVRESWDVILGVHRHSVHLAGTSVAKLDLDDKKAFRDQLESIAPDLVVHAAGLTNVDRCEEMPHLAQQANASIAMNVAIATAEMNIRLVHISTDHLFPGTRSLYRENEPTSPLNEYGRSKARAELWVSSVHREALIIRTNFFGWGSSQRQSFSDWLLAGLRVGKPLSLFEDVYYTPILAERLALLTHRLVEKGAHGIFNVAGDQRLSKYEFGLALARRFDLPIETIRPEKMNDAKFSAVRPRDMSLSNTKTTEFLHETIGSVPEFLNELYAQELSGRSLEMFTAVDNGDTHGRR